MMRSVLRRLFRRSKPKTIRVPSVWLVEQKRRALFDEVVSDDIADRDTLPILRAVRVNPDALTVAVDAPRWHSETTIADPYATRPMAGVH